MRTISVLLYKRPELFEQTMSALINCQDLGKFDRLIFSVDGGHPMSKHCFEAATACAELFSREGLIDTIVIEQENNLGVARHPEAVLTFVFEKLGSDLNVCLEDDAVPKKDWLRIVLWWEEFQMMMFPDSALIAGCNHRDFGRNQNNVPNDPSLIVESAHIPSPFCWATTKLIWDHAISKFWNFKQEKPLGWDWSLSLGMRLNRMIAMHPVLSRCQNIGRSNGTHESEATFDATQTGLTYQEDEYFGPYKLVGQFDRSDLSKFDAWMLPEIQRMKGLEVTPWKG